MKGPSHRKRVGRAGAPGLRRERPVERAPAPETSLRPSGDGRSRWRSTPATCFLHCSCPSRAGILDFRPPDRRGPGSGGSTSGLPRFQHILHGGSRPLGQTGHVRGAGRGQGVSLPRPRRRREGALPHICADVPPSQPRASRDSTRMSRACRLRGGGPAPLHLCDCRRVRPRLGALGLVHCGRSQRDGDARGPQRRRRKRGDRLAATAKRPLLVTHCAAHRLQLGVSAALHADAYLAS